MARNGLSGLSESYALFDSLTQQAQDELTVDLAIIGREGSALQKATVPVGATGALQAALTWQMQAQKLRVRMGLLGSGPRTSNGRARKTKMGGPFYGIMVERGRKEQVVTVTRRMRAYSGSQGRLRSSGPNKGTPVGGPYAMRVKAMAPRPFVHIEQQIEPIADERLSNFWARTLGRAGASNA